MNYPLGVLEQSLDVGIFNDSGMPVTGLVADTFPPLTFSLAGANADVSFGSLTDLASITTAWTSGGLKERGGGRYRLDALNSMFATAGYICLRGEASGQHLVYPIIEVIAGLGTGTGANTVTITVNDGTNPIQNAAVRLTSGAQTYIASTNVSGQVVFNLNSATWTVAISNPLYTFSGASLVVSASTTQTYSMTAVTITPSNPGYTTGYATCYDQNGSTLQNVSVSCTLIQTSSTDTGSVYDNTTVTNLSNSSGIVQFPNLVLGATYQFSRGGNKVFNMVIPSTAGATYALPSIIGAP